MIKSTRGTSARGPLSARCAMERHECSIAALYTAAGNAAGRSGIPIRRGAAFTRSTSVASRPAASIAAGLFRAITVKGGIAEQRELKHERERPVSHNQTTNLCPSAAGSGRLDGGEATLLRRTPASHSLSTEMKPTVVRLAYHVNWPMPKLKLAPESPVRDRFTCQCGRRSRASPSTTSSSGTAAAPRWENLWPAARSATTGRAIAPARRACT